MPKSNNVLIKGQLFDMCLKREKLLLKSGLVTMQEIEMCKDIMEYHNLMASKEKEYIERLLREDGEK